MKHVNTSDYNELHFFDTETHRDDTLDDVIGSLLSYKNVSTKRKEPEYSLLQPLLFAYLLNLSRIKPMQMQDRSKGMQAKCGERVKMLCKQLPALFPQRITIQIKSMQRKYELKELSNVIIYVVRVN